MNGHGSRDGSPLPPTTRTSSQTGKRRSEGLRGDHVPEARSRCLSFVGISGSTRKARPRRVMDAKRWIMKLPHSLTADWRRKRNMAHLAREKPLQRTARQSMTSQRKTRRTRRSMSNSHGKWNMTKCWKSSPSMILSLNPQATPQSSQSFPSGSLATLRFGGILFFFCVFGQRFERAIWFAEGWFFFQAYQGIEVNGGCFLRFRERAHLDICAGLFLMQVCPRQAEVHVRRSRFRAGARDVDGGPCVYLYNFAADRGSSMDAG